MKIKLLATIISVFIYNIALSQSIDVYGLMPSSNPNLDYVRLAELDAVSGNIITIDSVKPVSAYGFGTSVFDSYHQTYSFIGVDTNMIFRFNSWGVINDSMYAMPPISETINDLEYDMQTLEFYGLGSYAINVENGEYALRFLNIDQFTGNVLELKKMPEANAFPVGSTTYGSNDGIYYANILTSNFESKLYAINRRTGDTNYTVPLTLPNGLDFMNFEYNNEDDLIYGLMRDYSANWYAIGSINPVTGMIVDTIYEINDLQYFVQGASVFHQMSQNYILYYTDNDNNSRLLSVNVLNGSLTSNPIVPGYLSDLQVDNYEYAMSAYHGTVNISEKNYKSDFLIYPNPAQNILNIESVEGHKARSVRLLNSLGQEVIVNTHANSKMDLTSLNNGLYLLEIITDTNKYLHKIIVQ